MPSEPSERIRIVIVDDTPRVRQGLVTILEMAGDFEIVGEASNGVAAINAAEAFKPDVMLMDLEMPALGGLEATRRIKDLYSEIGIVILTIHGGDKVREQAARAGADAFVEKEAPTEQLIAAIREVGTASEPNAEGDES